MHNSLGVSIFTRNEQIARTRFFTTCLKENVCLESKNVVSSHCSPSTEPFQSKKINKRKTDDKTEFRAILFRQWLNRNTNLNCVFS